MSEEIKKFLDTVSEKNPNQPEFLQAVDEVAETIIPFMEENPKYKNHKLLERMVEPERVVMFRVTWLDDNGEIQVNRGYRVQMNSAIGPYKGGLRFHPSVNLSILKFLAFEQVFKNSLTTLPMGGGKGGSDFDPKGKSDNEVMRFCQSFMTELYRHIGNDKDVPAGDIGVGGREIGYLFGQYKRIQNEFTGILTGKGPSFGGSLIRPEATGYGVVYFTKDMLERNNEDFSGKKVAISGSGNVAQYAFQKAIHLGAVVVTLSDSSGFVYSQNGFHSKEFDFLQELKNERRGRIHEMADKFEHVEYFEGKKPWDVGTPIDIALPCATQNELNEDDAYKLVNKKVRFVAEGANMPCTPEAVEYFHKKGVIFAPGKASNAGGVSVSGLEMSQNSMRYNWTSEEVDSKLKQIMNDIHEACVTYGKDKSGHVDYVKGANIAGFVKVADAMIAQGAV
ncbi:NADP-specific glutamate dehydrogenase [Psychroflexus sp. CAK57W]|uniref:NADP-specific glutamate dehydrogenase n=1 Tax=Psychroflexus curvus TaxID=2873595 RepID=UPI001CCB7679|nr:NADP-specific glutamate dehydrogenase [Psychroflexus curvus]MBZ9787050.1 NADP-specific glutamate dehydrogenase [Psychroflexus curvus]